MSEFDDFVVARGPGLLRFAFVLTADHHLAEDLVQTALLGLSGSWSRVVRADSPDAYARRAVMNAFLSWRRRPSRWQRHAELDDRWPERADPYADLGVRDELWRLVVRLPRRERAALVLRFYEDLDDREAAQVMGCTAGTVRAHVSRGLARLRREMTPPETATRLSRK